MTAAEALRRLEQRLVLARNVGGQDAALAEYHRDSLPAAMDARAAALVDQGFLAGYASAMRAASAALTAVQTDALRPALEAAQPDEDAPSADYRGKRRMFPPPSDTEAG